MWLKDIVSDLFKEEINIKGQRYKVGIDPTYEHVKGGLPMLKEHLPTIECFYMGNLDIAQKYIDQFEKSEEDMRLNYDYENISFPKSMTLWEYLMPKGGLHGVKKEALFVLDSVDQVFIWPITLSPELNMWVPGMYWIFLHKVPTGRMQLVCPSDLKEDEREDFEEAGRRVVSYVLAFLKIRYSKNAS